MAISQTSADFLLNSRMADAEAGDVEALFELGVTFSTGRGEIGVDLIERISGSTWRPCRATRAAKPAAPTSASTSPRAKSPKPSATRARGGG